MRNHLAANILPSYIRTQLFGYRKEDSIEFNENDPDWKLWQSAYHDFYDETQTSGFGGYITGLGYRIIKKIDLSSKNLLEIGPGSVPHLKFWNKEPKRYVSVEIDSRFNEKIGNKIKNHNMITRSKVSFKIDVPDESIDIILTFYSLEHLMQLDENLLEFHRILKNDGIIVGAIPNEGGLAWGLGRFFFTRRWIRNRYKINYDKIISWEHPSYCDEIRDSLDRIFDRIQWSQYPFPFLRSFNINLISTFIYRKHKI